MNTNNTAFTLEIVHDSKPDHLTEDTYLALTDEGSVILAVADGAPQRVKTSGSMRPLLDRYSADMTPGGYAARFTRDRLRELFTEQPDRDLTSAVLAVNTELGEDLKAIYGGELTTDTVLAAEPDLPFLAEDPRFIRLVLPVCCITVARVDVQNQQLEVAHGADTALFFFHDDGRVEQVTPDQMEQHDHRALSVAQRLFHESGETDYNAWRAPVARAADIRNGIYHNFENPDGTPDASVGVGVMNGLPQLEHYLFTATRSLEGVAGILLASDGIYWASPLETAQETLTERLLLMRQKIEAHGLSHYVAEKRDYDQQTFPASQYPVIGRNDDITGIYARILN
ncbi:MAG: hypothetical protein AAFV33_05640 [Chloroflexota bacterium]